jgi:hypothetical protein
LETPRTIYENRLAALDARMRELAVRTDRIAFSRLGIFAALLIVAWMSISREWLSAAWLFLPFAAFILLLIIHERVKRAIEATQQLYALYQFGIARIEGSWMGKGDSGSEFAQEAHPYASDLDLFGRGSLFELLCAARTSLGRTTLARWLTAPAPRETIETRRAAIDELKPHIDLREKLALVGRDSSRALTSKNLRSWATGADVPFTAIEKWVAPLIAAFASVSLLLWFTGRGAILLLIAVIVEMLYSWRLHKRVQSVREPISHAAAELGRVSEVLAIASAEQFANPRLRELFHEGSASAADVVRRLVRLIDLLDAMRNQFFAPFGALLLWNAQVTFRIEAWRKRWGKELVQWMENIGEFETLVSLSTYAFEHPHHATAEVTEGLPLFVATDLAHPLLGAEAIGNDVSLGEGVDLSIVSGSNMSGKSTLMRSIGTNAVLAYCGAPVRARSLRLAVMNIGASIRINDSLQEGSSRFYAELTRIKQIVDLTSDPLPLLFLLDEIFNGTNSHDRRIGAEAVLRRLLKSRAVGLVTTHDLALAKLSESSEGRARNVHFEDHLEEGRMRFDYRIKEGVVTHSNALELMRAVGLEV